MKDKICGLFCEYDKLSLGRVSFWIFTVFIIYYWLSNRQDIPANISMIYMSILAYNLFKKPIRVVEAIYGKNQSKQENRYVSNQTISD